jgi:CheY-like chemotaxis protein
MKHDPVEMMTPRILVVDDERQIHASLRLRLGARYELACVCDAREALKRVAAERFDLCIADIHMPHLNGLAFIEAAQKADPGLGYIVLSAFDSDENLRKTIPLQVYDFLPKPLPERSGFEARIPEWIDRTRRRRRDQSLAQSAGTIADDLDAARIEREAEIVASETARDALQQTANLLTTIHAHLVTATTSLAPRARLDSGLQHLYRNLDEARKTADAAVTVAEGFFDSAYGNRDTSGAFVDAGIRHAIGIATRTLRADEARKGVDFTGVDNRTPLRAMSGIDFLLMMTPAIGVALSIAPANTTVGVAGQHIGKLDLVTRDPHFRRFLWINRRTANTNAPGIAIVISASAPAFLRPTADEWFKGDPGPLAGVPARGLLLGLQKCKGLLGVALAPESERFRLVLAVPT